MTQLATKQPQFVWTAERVLVLQQLVAAGFSMSAIGQKLGVSRNAVIGKYHRVQAETSVTKPEAKVKAPAKPAAQSKPERAHDQVAHKAVQEEQRRNRPDVFGAVEPGHRLDLSRYRCEGSEPVNLFEMRSRQCKFPLEDWQTRAGPTTLFCGAATETETGSWCPAHARLVFGAGTRSEQKAEKALLRVSG